MRLLAPLLALLVVAAAAGCTGGGEDDDTTPPTASSPAVTTPAVTPTEPTPSPSVTPEPTPEPTPPAPEGPAKKEVYNATFDFASQGDPTGQSPKTQKSTAVLEGHKTLFVNVTLARSSSTPTPLPVSGTLNSPAVRILDPQGTEVVAITTEGTHSGQFPAVPGEWSIRYEGAGTLQATVTLTAVA